MERNQTGEVRFRSLRTIDMPARPTQKAAAATVDDSGISLPTGVPEVNWRMVKGTSGENAAAWAGVSLRKLMRASEPTRVCDDDWARAHGIRTGDTVGLTSRSGEIVLPALVTDRVRPGVVYTTFHFPESGANVVTTDNSDWATNCPEYKVTAVQVMPVSQPSEWQREYQRFNRQQLELAHLESEASGS